VSVTRVPVSSDSLARLITGLRRELAPSEDLEQCTETGAVDLATAAHRLEALARILIPENVRATLRERGSLVVVPDGILNLLPFAALPLRGGVTLGEIYAVQYVPSVSVLAHLERGGAASAEAIRGARGLVVGDPEMPTLEACGTRARLMKLPVAGAFAREEAHSIGSTYLTGVAATEDSVVKLLPSASLILLATHGYAYPSASRARESWVALAPTAKSDGFLTANEILEGDRLSAELVVLAACNTALGDVRQSEGTVGLQRALLGKGARSVLVSLWPMREEPAVQLLRAFFREWLQGADHPTKSEALRRAQLEVRERFPDARDWAGFQLVGSD
jgi:CHAT domain-containing protein